MLPNKTGELAYRLSTQVRHMSTLLQEVNDMMVGIPGYDHCTKSSITRNPTCAGTAIPGFYGETAVYVDHALLRAVMNETYWCTGGQKIAALRTKLYILSLPPSNSTWRNTPDMELDSHAPVSNISCGHHNYRGRLEHSYTNVVIRQK